MEVSIQNEQVVKREAGKTKEVKKKTHAKGTNINKCRSGFKSLKRAPLLWVFFSLLLTVVLVVVLGFLVGGPDKLVDADSWKGKLKTFELYYALSAFIFLLSVCFVRLSESSSICRRIKNDKSLTKRNISLETTPGIQETYIGLFCRKCVHYWVSLAIGSFSVLAILYVLILGLGDRLIKGSWDVMRMGIFKSSTYSSLSFSLESIKNCLWADWSTKLCVVSLVAIILNQIQFWTFNVLNNKKIAAFEAIFGRENLVNDCMLCYRVNRVNKKYKIITFSFVCLAGCMVYIFFKRAIVAVFDKSFGI